MRSSGNSIVRPGTIAALALFTLGACSGSSSGPAAEREPADFNTTVTIAVFQFKPSRLEVDHGATVSWTQSDETIHTVTSGTSDPVDSAGRSQTHPDGSFDSGDLDQGKKFTFTFDRSGNYPYFCARHPEGMRGEIVVR